MFGSHAVQTIEKTFFRNLNRVLEPTIRAGIGSPWLVPVGAVVLETVGRKSGRVYNVPVLASEFRGVLVVSTVRGRSQWIRNVAAQPAIGVWLRGSRRDCRAYVVTGGEMRTEGLAEPSTTVQWLIDSLKPLSKTGVIDFAVLVLEAQTESAGDEAHRKAFSAA